MSDQDHSNRKNPFSKTGLPTDLEDEQSALGGLPEGATRQDGRSSSHRPPAVGRSGSISDIGAELGLDFEPDALLDSLLSDDPSSTPLPIRELPSQISAPRPTAATLPDPNAAAAALKQTGINPLASPSAPKVAPSSPFQSGPKLHEPEQRLFPADEETRTSIQRIAPQQPDAGAALADAPLPGVMAPVRAKPPLPTERGAMGRVNLGASKYDHTQVPPAVNPAGLPPIEPFPPANSPSGPQVSSFDQSTPTSAVETNEALFDSPGFFSTEEMSELGLDELLLDGGLLDSDRVTPPTPVSAVNASEAFAEPSTSQAIDDLSALDELSAKPGSGLDEFSLFGQIGDEGVQQDEISQVDLGALLVAPDTRTAEPPAALPIEPSAHEPNQPAQNPLLDLPEEYQSAPPSQVIEPIADSTEYSPGKEQPAVDYLLESGETEAWLERAQWLEAEAESIEDPAARSRCLVVASELWAMAGAMDRAAGASQAALKFQKSPLAVRQGRWLAQTADDWSEVASRLDQEIIASPTPEARAHAAYFSSEINRLLLEDRTASAKQLAAVARLTPSDPRPHLFKLTAELAQSAAAPSLSLAEDDAELKPLRRAARRISTLRSGDIQSNAPAAAYLNAARHALSQGNTESAGVALAELSQLKIPTNPEASSATESPSLNAAAKWLASTLLAHDPQTQIRSLELLEQLAVEYTKAERAIPVQLARALAARGLETSARAAIELALSKPEPEAFNPADQIAISALNQSGAALTDAERVNEALLPLEQNAEGRPLALAYYAAQGLTESASRLAFGQPNFISSQQLGRSFADPSALQEIISAFIEGKSTSASTAEEASPEADAEFSALLRALKFEQAVNTGNTSGAASLLGEQAGPDAETDRQLAAALAHEITGEASAATAAYQRAHSQAPEFEAPLRALLATSASGRAAHLLEESAKALSDETHRASLLIEAALRIQQDDPSAASQLLVEAQALAPHLPLSYRHGEFLARVQGDPGKLLDWLRLRRDASADPLERALDQVREALLIADEEPSLATSLIAEAIEARPDDIGLRELGERLGSLSLQEQALWRETAALSAPPKTQARLLLEAALKYEAAGDLEAAARGARVALEVGNSPLAAITRERTAPGTQEGADLAELLLTQAKAATEPAQARELYERLSQVDSRRGDMSSALLWQSVILEETSDYLPALRKLEHAYLSSRREDELITIEQKLASLLPENTGLAHTQLATRLIKKLDDWLSAKETVFNSNHPEPKPYWLLREQALYAQVTGDDQRALDVLTVLAAEASTELDAATLYLRAAESAARLQKFDQAKALLDQALERTPDHLIALTTRADILESLQDQSSAQAKAIRAAEAMEAVAQASVVPAHQLETWYQAGILWAEKAADQERACSAFEQAAEIDVTYADLFERLKKLYVENQERAKLANLLEARLNSTEDPAERVALEVTRAKALSEIGDNDAARSALVAALDADPSHLEALKAFAELCSEQGDYAEAEQAFIRLARHTQSPADQAEIYRKLGVIYQEHLPAQNRAEISFREVIKRKPDDIHAREQLIRIHSELGQPEPALALQDELLQLAESADDKRDRNLQLASLYEQVAGDQKKAEAIFERVRKASPTDTVVLRAVAEYYSRTGATATLHLLLDRTAADIRRALSTGRFDAAFFDCLACVYELRGDEIGAQLVEATLSAIVGGAPVAVRGAGAQAGNPLLDDLLAPELLSPPLRAFLSKTGRLVENAYPVDLKTLRAQPLPQELQGLSQQISQLARAFGVHNVEVLMASHIGRAVTPVSSQPPQLLVGRELLEADDQAALYFAVFRALKIIQSNTCGFARIAAIDSWSSLAALLSLYMDNWRPQGADAKKFAVAQQRFKAVAAQFPMDQEVPVLALEVAGNIGNRASQLAAALQEWGNRTALVAVGDPRAAFRVIGGADLPTDEEERVKWVTRTTAARDLAIFSVSENYTQARKQVGG